MIPLKTNQNMSHKNISRLARLVQVQDGFQAPGFFPMEIFRVFVFPLLIAMFFASDDEGPSSKQPGPVRRSRSSVDPVPKDLAFLQKSCNCKRRNCLQQFLDMTEAVQSKRNEFKAMPPHKKAGCFLF